MSGKAVLITGGAKRVGAAASLYLAKQGYDIALHYNHSKQDALEVQKQVRALGRVCEIFELDLAKTPELAGLVKKAKAAFPNLVGLVNNASVFERAELLAGDEALFDRQFGINLKAPVFLTQAFAKQVGKGSVVNLIDSNVTKTHGSHFFYLMSKKSLEDFTIMAARQLGPDVRVNGVCPGVVLPSSEEMPGYEESLRQTNPLRVTANVEQVCEAIHLMLENSALTGQMMFIDGGRHTL